MACQNQLTSNPRPYALPPGRLRAAGVVRIYGEIPMDKPRAYAVAEPWDGGELRLVSVEILKESEKQVALATKILSCDDARAFGYRQRFHPDRIRRTPAKAANKFLSIAIARRIALEGRLADARDTEQQALKLAAKLAPKENTDG